MQYVDSVTVTFSAFAICKKQPKKGALEGRAKQITEEMKLAAANAIASLVSDEELSDDNIMPQAFDPRVAEVVANAVKANIRN